MPRRGKDSVPPREMDSEMLAELEGRAAQRAGERAWGRRN